MPAGGDPVPGQFESAPAELTVPVPIAEEMLQSDEQLVGRPGVFQIVLRTCEKRPPDVEGVSIGYDGAFGVRREHVNGEDVDISLRPRCFRVREGETAGSFAEIGQNPLCQQGIPGYEMDVPGTLTSCLQSASFWPSGLPEVHPPRNRRPRVS